MQATKHSKYLLVVTGMNTNAIVGYRNNSVAFFSFGIRPYMRNTAGRLKFEAVAKQVFK